MKMLAVDSTEEQCRSRDGTGGGFLPREPGSKKLSASVLYDLASSEPFLGALFSFLITTPNSLMHPADHPVRCSQYLSLQGQLSEPLVISPIYTLTCPTVHASRVMDLSSITFAGVTDIGLYYPKIYHRPSHSMCKSVSNAPFHQSKKPGSYS